MSEILTYNSNLNVILTYNNIQLINLISMNPVCYDRETV